jgi:hypothetical protein
MGRRPDPPPITPYDAVSSAATSSTTLEGGRQSPSNSKRFTTEPSPDQDDTATVAEREVEGDPTDLVGQRQAEEEGRDDALTQLSDRKEQSTVGRVWRVVQKVLNFLLEQWFVLGVGFVIVSLKISSEFRSKRKSS